MALLKVMERRSRYLGLDAPKQLAVDLTERTDPSKYSMAEITARVRELLGRLPDAPTVPGVPDPPKVH